MQRSVRAFARFSQRAFLCESAAVWVWTMLFLLWTTLRQPLHQSSCLLDTLSTSDWP